TCAPPACLDPYGLSASNGTSSSIDVSWTGGPNAASYNVEYGVTGYTQGSGTTTTASTASTTITGLTAYTLYDFYVQADCGANGTSTWAGPISYSTCPGAAPYLENFDATPTSLALTSATGPCWTQSTNDVFDWIINNGPTTSQTTGPSDDITGGGNYMYTETSVPRAAGDSAILISPAIDISSLTSSEISFQLHMYGASMGTLRVDASSDGGTTFNTIWTRTGDQGDLWTEEIVQLTGFTTTAIVKFVSTVGVDAGGTISYWSDMAIDNFQVRQSATCPQTSPLTASNVASSSADVSWTAGGTETSWNVEYGAAGFTLGTGTNTNVTSTTYSMTGLTPSTDYDVYVQAVCSATDQSFWVGPLAVSTPFVQPGCGDTFGPYCYGAGAFTVFTSVVTNPGDFITLNITAGETEVGYDNLQIYDGVGATGNLLYDADGDHTGVSVLSTTGTITMYINGDAIWNCIDGVGGPYVPIEANVTCTTPSALDMQGVAMTTPSTIILANGPVTVSGELKNMGTTTVTSMDVNYTVDGGATVTESLSGLSLATGDNYDFNHGTTWSPTAAGVYDIAVWATNINGASDMNTANDMVSGQVTVYDNATIRRPMLESFTSSTCGPCVAGNVNVASVLTAYSDDQYSLLKYQMSWPGSGDPYYTLEGGDRRTYYNVNAVPDFILDGNVWQGNSSSLTNSQVDAVIADPSFAEISSYFTVTGQTVDITVSINPVGDFTNSLTLYTAIYEIKTYNNVGSNGETEFGNVMKKMVPGSMGFALPTLQTGVSVVENFSHTFQGSYTLPPDANSPIDHSTQHSIEDFNNLGVVTWIQDDATKEVIQSTVSTISATNVEELNTTKLMLFPNPAENTATVAFEGLEGSDVKIDLYNLLGELVFTGNHTSASSFDYYNIDVTTLNNGIYNLVLTVG
ncbi:fibronectin type III domain-containing protein, partial [Flavobacteriales bacterium]|nr:fibronectin type III domain-containing protein [Flavobacteriales bacterium]